MPPAQPADYLPGRRLVLCAGRLVPGKGFEQVLRALARLQGELRRRALRDRRRGHAAPAPRPRSPTELRPGRARALRRPSRARRAAGDDGARRRLRPAQRARRLRARAPGGDDPGHARHRLSRPGTRRLHRRRRQRLPGAVRRRGRPDRRSLDHVLADPAARHRDRRGRAAPSRRRSPGSATRAACSTSTRRSSPAPRERTDRWTSTAFSPARRSRRRRWCCRPTFANGLGIIRDLAAHGVPVLALDFNPRAVGQRSRLRRRPGLPRSQEGRGGLPPLPRGPRPRGCRRERSSSRPTTSPSGRCRGTPSGCHPGTSCRSRAGTRWCDSTTSASRWSRLALRRRHAAHGVRGHGRRPRARRRRDRLPGHPQAGRLPRLQAALPPARARDRRPRRAGRASTRPSTTAAR